MRPGPVEALLASARPSLGPYVLERPLGRGGFAPVWLARHVAFGVELRSVALKLFPLSGSQDALDQVVREARALCAIDHENVVRFFALEVDASRRVAALVMEHLPGEPLSKTLARDGRLPVTRALEIGRAIAAALAQAHASAIVHRDVKPDNVVQAAGGLKLIDFGIASITGERQAGTSLVMDDLPLEASGTSFHGPLGTPGTIGYIDPHSLTSSAKPAPAGDLYGLGAVLFECLVGLVPSAAEGKLAGDILDGRRSPPRVADLRADVGDGFGELVDRLLCPDPSSRPTSATAVLERLDELLSAATASPKAPGGIDIVGAYETELGKAIAGGSPDSATYAASLLRNVGESLLAAGDPVGAARRYTRVASGYEARGEKEAALAAHRRVTEIASAKRGVDDEANSLTRTVVLLRELGRAEEARAARSELGRTLVAGGRHGEAVGVLREILSDDPEHATARLWLAEALAQTGDVEGSLREADSAASLFLAKGKRDQAIRVLERMVTIGASVAQTQRLAELYLARGHRGDALLALARLQAAHRSSPHPDPRTFRLLGTAFEQLGRLEAAAEVWRALERLAKDTGKVRIAARARERLDALPEGLVQRADEEPVSAEWLGERLDPADMQRGDAEFAKRSARMYLDRDEAGDREKARAKLTRALEVDPDDIDALRLLLNTLPTADAERLSVHRRLARAAAIRVGSIDVARESVAVLHDAVPGDPEVLAWIDAIAAARRDAQ